MRLPSARTAPSTDWVLQLINIVFLLLLYFLANGTILTRQELGIEPPRSGLTKSGSPPSDAIYIDAAGTVKFRGSVADAPGIAAALKLSAIPLSGVQIVADHRLKAAVLIDRLQEFKKNGVRATTLLTIRDQAR